MIFVFLHLSENRLCFHTANVLFICKTDTKLSLTYLTWPDLNLSCIMMIARHDYLTPPILQFIWKFRLTHWPLGYLNEILDKYFSNWFQGFDGWGISCEIALRWMSLYLTDDKSTLIQVMVGAVRQHEIWGINFNEPWIKIEKSPCCRYDKITKQSPEF